MLLDHLVRLLCECLVAAAAIAMIWEACRYLRSVVDEHRRHAAYTTPDPVEVAKWQLLAEARSITETAAREQEQDAAG